MFMFGVQVLHVKIHIFDELKGSENGLIFVKLFNNFFKWFAKDTK